MSGGCNNVGDALDRLPQHVIRDFERFEKRGRFIDNPQQPLVRNDEQCIDVPTQVADSFLRVLVSPFAFILKWSRDDAYREDTYFTRDAGHNGGGSGAGPSSHPRRDEDHIGPFQTFSDVLFTLKRGISTDFRLCPRPHPRVRSGPSWILYGANDRSSACRSVLLAIKSSTPRVRR